MLVRRVRAVNPTLDNLPDFDPVRREVLRTFGVHTQGTLGALGAEIFPRMNITQDDDNLYLHAEIPGVDPEQLSISALGNSVCLAGKRQLSATCDGQEPGDCAFDCTVALPAEVDAERMDARYCDGVLALTLPKVHSGASKECPS